MYGGGLRRGARSVGVEHSSASDVDDAVRGVRGVRGERGVRGVSFKFPLMLLLLVSGEFFTLWQITPWDVLPVDVIEELKKVVVLGLRDGDGSGGSLGWDS